MIKSSNIKLARQRAQRKVTNVPEKKWYQTIQASDVGNMVIVKRIDTYDTSIYQAGENTAEYVRLGVIEMVDNRPAINVGDIRHDYFDENGVFTRYNETEYVVYGIEAGYTEDMETIPEIEDKWKRTFFKGERTQLSPTYAQEYVWQVYHEHVHVCIDCMMKSEHLDQSNFDQDHNQRYTEAQKHGRIDIVSNMYGELGITAFSKTPCEYCGSELAGERYKAIYTAHHHATNPDSMYFSTWTLRKASI